MSTLIKLGVLSLGSLVLAVGSPASASGTLLPDLVVKDISLSHAQAAPDTVVGVTFTVANLGGRDAPGFRVAIYHSDELVTPARGNVTRIGARQMHLGVARGQSETVKVNVRLPPCDACKPGYLYAFADAWGNVVESNEQNNFKSAPIQIQPEFRPNLRLENVSIAPDRGALGQVITIGAKLKNDSQFHAYGPIKLTAVCSRDFVIDAADTRIASFSAFDLKPGAETVISKQLTVLPSCRVHGQHVQLGLLVDPDNAIVESDENDNGTLVPYWVLRAPDLEPGVLHVAPASGPPGTRFSVSFTARNNGKQAAPGVEVGVFLGKSERVTVKDTRVGTHTIAALPPGRTTMTLGDNLFIPDLASGSYWVGVVVDTKHEAGDLREYNNMKAATLRVARVNLTDRFFFVESSKARPGDRLKLRFSLRNLGRDEAGPFNVGFYYSDDPRFDVNDAKLGERSFVKLARGDERGQHELEVTLPKNAPAGYRYLLMVTDDGGDVLETDELDNVALRPVLLEP